MCGIAGIIGRIGARNRAALERMSDAMLHRGPDGHGTWESPADARGFGALLAHRRLAILDLSPAGAQPMVDPVTGHVIVFNGEIYNFQELRGRLTASGQTFQSSGDTAVLLRALGPQRPDAAAALGIESISPGQLRVYDAAGKEEVSRDFWTVPPPAPSGAMDEERLSALLEDCLRIHLVSDVPLGVFLSGGVDSSAVANLAQKANRAPVHTFTLAFEQPEYNEGPIARRIAEAIGTQHREVVLTEQQVVDQLDKALDSLDQPTFDGLNAYYMSKAVRQAGFTVALVGTGGDELFGGYTSFRDLPRLQRWCRRLRWMPREALASAARLATSILRRSNGAMAPQTRWAKLPDMLRRGDDLIALYQLAYALFLPDFQRALLPAGGALVDGLPPAVRARLERETQARSPLSAISVLEQRLFLGER